jgi:uncharacterized protein YdbL (DUF1318 family)
MVLKTLRYKPEDEATYKVWYVHSIKVIVVLLLLGIITATTALIFSFGSYYKSHQDNEKLLEAIHQAEGRVSFALIERETQIARGRALETYLLSVKGDKDTKQKILTINEVISQYVADYSKSPNAIPVSEVRDEVCKKLAEKQAPCYQD